MLAPGDEILDYDGGAPLTVISNVYEETTERVYNFEVEGTHTYFAGDVGAWVHNGKFKEAGRAFLVALAVISGEDGDQNKSAKSEGRYRSPL